MRDGAPGFHDDEESDKHSDGQRGEADTRVYHRQRGRVEGDIRGREARQGRVESKGVFVPAGITPDQDPPTAVTTVVMIEPPASMMVIKPRRSRFRSACSFQLDLVRSH